jgi:uncharacterized protein YkwD
VRRPSTVEHMREGSAINGTTQVRCGSNTYRYPPQEEVPAVFTTSWPKAKPEPAQPWLPKREKIVVLLIITAIVALGLAQRGRTSVAGQNADPGLQLFQEPLTREAIISLTNNTRVLRGLENLSENPLLDAIAEERAHDLLEKQYFAHVSPTGEKASDIAQKVGYRYQIIAENLASGLFFTNQKIVDGWMQSPGHRRNILSSEVKEIGASVTKGRMNGNDTWVSVQIFGLQSLPVAERSCMLPSEGLVREIDAKEAEIENLGERLTRLKQELDAESDSVELDRKIADSDPKRIYDLDVKIRTYNEKSNWHNQSLAEMNAKQTVLNSMVEEYNKAVKRYRNCKASN